MKILLSISFSTEGRRNHAKKRVKIQAPIKLKNSRLQKNKRT